MHRLIPVWPSDWCLVIYILKWILKFSFWETQGLRSSYFYGDGGLQSDDQCCNSCEEVREAYRIKGWAVTDPEIIDQVLYSSASGNWSFLLNICTSPCWRQVRILLLHVYLWIAHADALSGCGHSAKGRDFCRKLKRRMGRDVMCMDIWRSTKWQEIFTLHLAIPFSNWTCFSLTSWSSRWTISMYSLTLSPFVCWDNLKNQTEMMNWRSW